MYMGNIEDFLILSDDYNWNTKLVYIKDMSIITTRGFKGICRDAIDDVGVRPNGDVTLCGNWFDSNGIMLLGNLNEQSPQVIFGECGIFNRIIDEQSRGLYRGICGWCNFIIKNERPFHEK
jgi:hypothetical protein